MASPRASTGPGWHDSIWKRAQIAAIAGIVAPLLGLLCRTLRWEFVGEDPTGRLAASGRLPIHAFWHGRILTATYVFRHRGIVVMTSENFDGEWIARVIARFGYGAARGSTSRGGVRALVQMKRELEAGRSVAFTLDGPRGPARRAQPGAVWLARATGHPLFPFHIEAASYWTLGSWDRTQIPKPFSRVAVALGEPLFIEADVDDEGLETKRVALEGILDELEARAREHLGVARA